MDQICYNAKETGMIDDPRVVWDTPTPPCKHYKPKHNYPQEVEVCGNCNWYTVQE